MLPTRIDDPTTKEQLIKLLCDTSNGSFLRSLLQEESDRSPARIADILKIQKKDSQSPPDTKIEFVPFECSQGFKSDLASLTDLPFSTSKDDKEGKSIQRGEDGLLVTYVKDIIRMEIHEDKIKTLEQGKERINKIFADFIIHLKNIVEKIINTPKKSASKRTLLPGHVVSYKSFIEVMPKMSKEEERIISRVKYYYQKKIETPATMNEVKAFCDNLHNAKMNEAKSDPSKAEQIYSHVKNLAGFYMNDINESLKDFSAESSKSYQKELSNPIFAHFIVLMRLINLTAKTFKECDPKKGASRLRELQDVADAIKKTCMLFYNEGDTTACCIYLYKELLKMQKEKNIFMPSIMKRNNTFSTLLNKLIKRMDLILENNKIIITLPVEKNAPIPRKTKQLLNRQKSHAKLSASFFEARDSSHPSLHTKARHKNEFKIG